MKSAILFCLIGAAVAQWSEVCQLPADKGICRARIPRFYFDHVSGQCLPFTYGGCMGNPNNFVTIQECEKNCKDGNIDEHEEKNEDAEFFELACKPTPERGWCKGFEERWFFNVTSGTCQTFIYRGCGGNDNNYETQHECETACKG